MTVESAEPPEPSTAANAEAELTQEKRLHPLSWMFALILQLRQFALPLIVLMITGRSDNPYQWWGLIAVLILAIYSIVQYFTYRYRIVEDGIIIRSGLFQKNLRYITFDRIQNVSIQQNVLHQLFKVAEVKLETAGGAPGSSEGQMRVLSIKQAHAIEALVKTHQKILRSVNSGSIQHADTNQAEDELLALKSSELIRLGLISNKGMIVVGTFFAALSQTDKSVWGFFNGYIASHEKDIDLYARNAHLSGVSVFLSLIAFGLLFLVLVRVLSIFLALVQFHRFRLVKNQQRLSIERGLFTRLRGSLRLRRNQAYSLHESWLHRRFARQSLAVDTVSMEALNEGVSLRDVVPIAAPDRMNALIRVFLNSDQWPLQTWHALHPNAWRRKFFVMAMIYVIASAVMAYFVNPFWLAIGAIMLIFRFFYAKNWARYTGFAYSDDLIAVRQGWLSKNWRFAEIGKLQCLILKQNPFDRRHGMASIYFDTAGASFKEPPLKIDYLPIEQARALQKLLAEKISTKPLPF
jgi:putative membrane protein